jgi:endonuclease YncB( thermonuclease family)
VVVFGKLTDPRAVLVTVLNTFRAVSGRDELDRRALAAEPVTDRVDGYGGLLRYVTRASDGVDVNIRLVALGAAAPYFYEGRRGAVANQLEARAKRAMAKKLGLWGTCPRTADPYRGVDTRRQAYCLSRPR